MASLRPVDRALSRTGVRFLGLPPNPGGSETVTETTAISGGNKNRGLHEFLRRADKFYRGSSAKGRGAGIGLTICAAIVQAHRGEIEAGNRPEGGAWIRFTLPLTEDAPTAPSQEATKHV